MKRRSFLKTVGGTVATAAVVAHQGEAVQAKEEIVNGFPRRKLGRTDDPRCVNGLYPAG